MIRKKLIMSALIFLSGITFIFALFKLSQQYNHSHNNFTRLLPPHALIPLKEFDLKYNSYYIAGGSPEHIYLGNSTSPLHMVEINTMRQDTSHLRLKINGLEKFRSLEITVDSPFFYATDGTLPAIFKGNLETLVAVPYLQDSIYFIDSEPAGASSVILRSISNSTATSILIRESLDSPYVSVRSDILEKQVDGMFCTDGMLHYNRTLNNLVYLYRYRNQFISMDTGLNVLYKGKTIDTISHAQIKVAQKDDGSYTFSAPPLTVNNTSCTFGPWLFVNSNLLSRNEDKKIFDNTSVIDVYDLRNGVYKLSFYLEMRGNTKMRSFRVFGNTLIALHDQYALTYTLQENYFSK